jgi:poly(3-hydroxybutyrate) depolymerase
MAGNVSAGGATGGQGGGMAGAGGATAGAGGSTAGAGGGTAGAGGTAGSSGGSGGGLLPNNPPVKSAGCGKATQVTSGEKMIMSDNQQRSYTIDIPDNYDIDTPYRFVFASHWISSNDESVVNEDYYHLQRRAEEDDVPVIFLAPQALPGNPNGTWANTPGNDVDHIFFDDILTFVKANLCIDTTRVFAIGFSYGGMQTWSLSVNHQKDIRAAVGIAPANWNIYVPEKTGQPIAWMQTTGMGDNTCRWVNNDGRKEGAKYIALEHAANNGCTVPADVPTRQQGDFLCYDFEGCDPGYPTKACTYDGGHESVGSRPWISEEAWKFFMQF